MLKTLAKTYFDFLNAECKGLNLTAIKDFEELYVKQFEDSVLPLQVSQQFSKALAPNTHVLDVGCGGGIPIIPLAFARDSVKFLGIDGKGKKITAVRNFLQKSNLLNATVEHIRLEEIVIDIDVAIIFKAVGSISDLVQKIHFQVPPKLFFYKGPSFFSESKETLADVSGWKIEKALEYQLSTGDKRVFVEVLPTNLRSKPKNVPRGTFLSDLFLPKTRSF